MNILHLRTKWIVASMSCVGLVCMILLVRRLPSQPARHPVAYGVLYTETSTNAITGKSLSQDHYWYVRGDGSRAFGPLEGRTRRILDVPNKRELRLSDLLKQKTTYDYSFIPTPSRVRLTSEPCTPQGGFLVGQEPVLGYRTYHYQLPIRDMKDGTTTKREYWYAADLDCYLIQSVVRTFDQSGTLLRVFEQKPTQVTVGEPSASYFVVPDDYREVKPSELSEALLRDRVQEREGHDAALAHNVPAAVQQWWAENDGKYDAVKKRLVPVK